MLILDSICIFLFEKKLWNDGVLRDQNIVSSKCSHRHSLFSSSCVAFVCCTMHKINKKKTFTYCKRIKKTILCVVVNYSYSFVEMKTNKHFVWEIVRHPWIVNWTKKEPAKQQRIEKKNAHNNKLYEEIWQKWMKQNFFMFLFDLFSCCQKHCRSYTHW